MIEIIKTLLISLSFAATGAGIAWSVTSEACELPLIAVTAYIAWHYDFRKKPTITIFPS